MSPRRCLFVLSADFGEYVTANLFSRGQPFLRHFALPEGLARAGAGQAHETSRYASVRDLDELVARLRPELVVLASGYLFTVNNLMAPDALRDFVSRLRDHGIAVATTDPWLRVWKFRPAARFRIHSMRLGAEDEAQSGNMMRLRDRLERDFAGVPHLFAVPLPAEDACSFSFFNPRFTAAAEALSDAHYDDWVFVLSREDFAFLRPEGEGFLGALQSRLEEILAVPRNRVTFIGPAAMEAFFRERLAGRSRLRFSAACSFAQFEAALRGAKIVAYWNVLSASALYCLYNGVPPVFFGRGHQARVCEGLFEHAAEQVYRGRPPVLLDLAAPLCARAGDLAEQLSLRAWLDSLRIEYARSMPPDRVVERLLSREPHEHP